MAYQAYVKECLSNPELVALLPDKRVFRLKAPSQHQIPYVTYRFYDERGAYFAQGQELMTSHYVQIDVNSNQDYSDIVSVIKAIAKKEGWHKGAIFEDIDPETNLMFKCMRFSFDKLIEE